MKRRAIDGFTLLEVMISLAILAGVVMTVIGAVNYHLTVIAHERDDTMLTLLARQKIDELSANSSGQLAGEGRFTPSHPELAWKSEVLPTELPTLKKLVLKVQRSTDQRGVTLVRYLVP